MKGHFWGAPCATRVVDILNPKLQLVKSRAMTKVNDCAVIKSPFLCLLFI